MNEEQLRQWLYRVHRLGYTDPGLVISTDEPYFICLSAYGLSNEEIQANTFAEIMEKFEEYHKERKGQK